MTLSNRIRQYVAERPDLTRAEGGVYAISWQNDERVIYETTVDECPHCGEITTFQMGRTPCCGEVSDPHGYGGVS